ncbi:hypothetical protein AGMMS50212_00850 [Spirochaetia bacterium]|nr:hypothetical protein AGMMS50212_00850 [Spirochaetia bacterium]
MFANKRTAFLLFLFAVFAHGVFAENKKIELIGITIEELFSKYGAPVSVYAVRGAEIWQDDVVFEYGDIDFYIYKDRVWQISVKDAIGLNVGDPKAAVFLVLGETAKDLSSHILKDIPEKSWPLQWRFNINENGKVSSIFLYRMDY